MYKCHMYILIWDLNHVVWTQMYSYAIRATIVNILVLMLMIYALHRKI